MNPSDQEKLPAGLRELYPFKSRFVNVRGAQMHYLDEGRGEVVLMLHGNPTWSFMYRNFIHKLSENFRCIVPDHIGCGLSDKPQDYGYTLAQHIENIERLLSHLKIERFHLIAHDWGGAIGLGVAGRREERVGCIQIMNTAAFPDGRIPLRIAVCRVPLLGALLIRGLNAFAGGAVDMAVTHPLAPNVREGYLYPYNSWNNRIANYRFVQDIPMSPEHISYATLVEVAQNLNRLRDKPMQILWGMKDFCFNPHFLKRWTARFPEARVTRFPDAGHYVFEDESEACTRLALRFLEKQC